MPSRSRSMWRAFRGRGLPYALTGAFFLLWSVGLGSVPLFDWDEVNFAECAREMRQTGEYLYAQIGYLPFWEKPPLFFWVQALSMEIWGENALGARFPNAVIAALTLLALYETGRRWHGQAFGTAWLFLYGVSLLPAFYARSGLIDPLFNLFMLLATFAGSAYLRDHRVHHALLFGGLTALATLTKGPVGLFLPALAVGTLGLVRRGGFPLLQLAGMAIIPYALIVGGWITLLAAHGTESLLRDFWAYQWRLFSTADAGHRGPWYYHLVILSVGMFPATWWAVGARRLPSIPSGAQALLFLTGWTVLIFSIVQTKIIHYSSLAYYGLAYLGAWTWQHRRQWIHRWGWGLMTGGLFLLGLITVAAGFLMTQTELWLPYVRDPFVQAAFAEEPVHWTGWEGWIGFILLVGGSLLVLLRLGNWKRFFLAGALLSVWQVLVLGSFAPRAEAYTQAPLRRFCEEYAAEGAVIWALGFKSYIPYFYGQMEPALSPRLTGSFESFQNLLLGGGLPVPVYFATRIERYEGFVRDYALEVVERQGGYIFLRLRGERPQAVEPACPGSSMSLRQRMPGGFPEQEKREKER